MWGFCIIHLSDFFIVIISISVLFIQHFLAHFFKDYFHFFFDVVKEFAHPHSQLFDITLSG